MNPTQLRDALSHHDANPDTVLAHLHTKHRARRRRQYTLTGGLTAITLVALAASAWIHNTGGTARPTNPVIAAPSEAAPATPGTSPGAVAAGACQPLTQASIRETVGLGASLITAHST